MNKAIFGIKRLRYNDYFRYQKTSSCTSSYRSRFRTLQDHLNEGEKAQLKVIVEKLVKWTAERQGKKVPGSFDDDIQPFVDQVDCIASGKLKECPDAANELDEWHFAVETMPEKPKKLRAWPE